MHDLAEVEVLATCEAGDPTCFVDADCGSDDSFVGGGCTVVDPSVPRSAHLGESGFHRQYGSGPVVWRCHWKNNKVPDAVDFVAISCSGSSQRPP